MRPLAPTEVSKYLSFRMRAAGYRGPEVFTPAAVRVIARASGGLTRRINILADKSLLAAYTENTHAITARHVRAAVADSDFAAERKRSRTAYYVAAAAAAGLAIGAAVPPFLAEKPQPPPAAPVVPVAPAAPVAPPPMAAAPAPVLEPAPAPVVEVAKAPEPEPQLTPEQARRLTGYSAGASKLLAERLAATREVLERAEDERYAIELFITENTDPARMESFLLRARDMVELNDLYVIPVAGGGQYRLWVVYGDYATREEAAAAGKKLPSRYQEAFRAVPRSFGELRRQL
jgi:septal ring-binding cell division protein DamX